MKTKILLSIVFLSVFAGVSPSLHAQDFGDVLKQIVIEASKNYQQDSHYSDQTGYYPYTAPPREADAKVRNQHAYDVGYRVGQDDFHHHLSKHFVRHEDLYDDATHDAFGSGYGAGYDAARDGASNRDKSYQPPVASREPVKSDRYPSGYYPYSAPPQGQSDAVRQRHAYEVGFRVGQDDFNHGHSKHFTHHEDLFDGDTKDSFAHGYEEGYDKARAHQQTVAKPSSSPSSSGGGITSRTVQGGVEILVGGKVTTRIKSALPNVEKTKLINDGHLIVVKSRGDHGPAELQLFDTRTGVLKDKVMAFAVQGGRPTWAAPFADK
ncbi:MAG: hypothetical protein KDM64_00325 [Verrucomicrobiae bacterium]|nr:hypothetical protein [Verrucomicrobiae bacterium]